MSTYATRMTDVVPDRHFRLAVFATHPIQYQAPWFQALAREPGLDVHVYYALLPDKAQQGVDFGIDFEWDLPLLEDYNWTLLENQSAKPDLGHFRGCDVRDLPQVLRRRLPDAALITGWNSLYLLEALWACRRLHIPALVRGDSNTLAPRGRLKSWIQHRLIRQFSGFLAVGELNRMLYRQAGARPEQLFWCPHFVDNERFGRQAEELRPLRTDLRRQLQIPEDAVCFVFVGKLTRKKRVIDYLAAVAQAQRQNPDIYGLVVGSGAQRAEARAYVREQRAAVRFIGFLNQNEVAGAYVAADCLVLPSDHTETWGLVVNEAMACGTPAIVSDRAGCAPDLIREGETGATFEMGNVGELGQVILRLAADRSGLARMGRKAREHVNARYSIREAVEGVKTATSMLAEGIGI